MEEVKPAVRYENDGSIRDKSKTIALFAAFELSDFWWKGRKKKFSNWVVPHKSECFQQKLDDRNQRIKSQNREMSQRS